MRRSAIVGVVSVAVGFVALFSRGLAGLFDLSYLFVTVVGVVAIVLGLNAITEAREGSREAADVPDVELRYELPTPGEDVDGLLADAEGFSRASVTRRRNFHERLRAATLETLVARGEYPTTTAAERAVDAGTWTDDPVAAWFVGETPEPPWAVRARGVLGSNSKFSFATRRTVAALRRVQTGGEDAEAVATASERGIADRLERRLATQIGRLAERLPSTGGAGPTDRPDGALAGQSGRIARADESTADSSGAAGDAADGPARRADPGPTDGGGRSRRPGASRDGDGTAEGAPAGGAGRVADAGATGSDAVWPPSEVDE
ncbi:hypothetical protein RYH80_08330 [Halobaculum sp. MBLA0147]|uniref:DUF7269 family protein n=1 Tax=Halobaculum sp. MBLA0147 TaxID=3079934 RepID=UPI003524FFCC